MCCEMRVDCYHENVFTSIRSSETFCVTQIHYLKLPLNVHSHYKENEDKKSIETFSFVFRGRVRIFAFQIRLFISIVE